MEGETPTSICVSFTPSAEDLTRAYQCYNRARLGSRETLTAYVAILVLAAIVLTIAMPDDLIAVASILAGAAIGGRLVPLVLIRFWVPVLARRIYAQQRDLHEALTVEADAEALTTRAENSGSHAPWSHFIRSAEDDFVILFYRSEVLFQFIPKRALKRGQSDVLRSFAAAAGVQAAFRRSG